MLQPIVLKGIHELEHTNTHENQNNVQNEQKPRKHEELGRKYSGKENTLHQNEEVKNL